MATFLDVTGLAHFASIFVFLFAWIVVYAVLVWTKILGDNKAVGAILGFLFAIFIVISPTATNIIAGVAPFLAVVFIFIVLLSVATKMLGHDAELPPAIKGIFSLILLFVIVIGAGVHLKEEVDARESAGTLSNTLKVFFSPTILGVILLFAIAVFTIALLAGAGAHGH